jgi:hypothetical protein
MVRAFNLTRSTSHPPVPAPVPAPVPVPVILHRLGPEPGMRSPLREQLGARLFECLLLEGATLLLRSSGQYTVPLAAAAEPVGRTIRIGRCRHETADRWQPECEVVS